MNGLEKYKGIGRGKRIFLVGNGPSLNSINLDTLKGEYSIAMNRISLIYDQTSWRPSFYIFCSDNCRNKKWGNEWCKSVLEASLQIETTPIIWDRYKKEIERRVGKLPDKTIFLKSVSENKICSEKAFSCDANQRVDKSGTTMNVALQLAYYMEFSEVCLIGCDSNWETATNTQEKGDPNHFDENYHAFIGDGKEEFRRMNETHIRAKKEFDKAGIKVYNAGINSAIQVYPNIKLNQVI